VVLLMFVVTTSVVLLMFVVTTSVVLLMFVVTTSVVLFVRSKLDKFPILNNARGLSLRLEDVSYYKFKKITTEVVTTN
ncbi:hypothetical protein NG799_05525, partial [Laspinema sp. D1]|nr:hypothetical protein [Laspinema sp. D2a]